MKEKERKHLHLILKAKWYDMIEKGEKREEYRDFNRYLWRLLVKDKAKEPFRTKDLDELKAQVKKYRQTCRDFAYGGDDTKREDFNVNTQLIFDNKQMYRYHTVTFHRGYTNTTMTWHIEKIGMGEGQTDWGADAEEVYMVITLGCRMEDADATAD